MGPLGWQETLVIFALALLVFGPKKLPELGKTIGKALTEFRRASSELKSTWDREMVNLERENESLKETASSIQSELSEYGSSYNYDGGSYDEPSCDFTAESPSTVSASAPEGAELAADVTPETGVAQAEQTAEYEGTTGESVVADAASESGAVPKPAGAAEGDPAAQAPAASG